MSMITDQQALRDALDNLAKNGPSAAASAQLKKAIEPLLGDTPNRDKYAAAIAAAATSGHVVGGVYAPWMARDPLLTHDAVFAGTSVYEDAGLSTRVGLGPAAFVSAPFRTIPEVLKAREYPLTAQMKAEIERYIATATPKRAEVIDKPRKEAESSMFKTYGAVIAAAAFGVFYAATRR